MTTELLPAIGGYQVERELGAGGMGRVYLATDAALQRKVALKVLLPELLEQSEMRQRFLREARALARVSSPHVVQVYAVGEDPVVGPFVVMEYLEGEDLQARLRREGRLPWASAVRYGKDAVQGLKAAEGAGIVHRDVKPANLFVVGERALITDFGLAREVKGAGVTQAGLVVGTPAYLAPEVIRGNAATHQSDLYSLGATLFHLVAGRPPFTEESPLEVLATALRTDAPELRSLVEVPPALSALVARMLAKDPAARPTGWDTLDAELTRLLELPADAAPRAASTQLFGSLPASAAPPSSASPSIPGVPDGGGLLTSGSLPTMAVAPPSATPGTAALASSSAPASSSAAPASVVTSGELAAAAPRVKTSTLTVMMTDIAGYSERTGRVSREESARWLALHDALLQPVFRAFGGRVVKTLGDAFLVTFPSPTDAVLCACAVQDRLWQHNKGASAADQIEVRIALSAGEVRLAKGDVFGEPVNLAARLEAVAKPGEVLLTDAVYATMNAAEVRLTSRGEQSFKGISRPVMVYAAQPDGVLEQPPFGARALARVKDTRMDALVAQAPIAVAKAQNAAGAMKSALLRMRRPQLLVALGAAAAVAIAVVVLANLGDDRLARIADGEAKEVLAETEAVAEAVRTGVDWAVIGHARLALGAREKGFAAFAEAVNLGVVDDAMKRALLIGIEEKKHDGAVEVLAAWPGAGITDELRRLLKDEAWWRRHNAMAVLEQKKQLSDDERVRVALLDVTSVECADRRYGLGLLRRFGKDQTALEAARALGADPLRNACMLFEIQGTEAAIKKRMAG
ncbi:MAG: protein kinase [Deltaproteobacteria bacterium]|nr:protein kinase [Deltaproteobacteria bacterium]